MEQALKAINAALPLIFAFAFLVPVIAQSMAALGVSAPFELPHLSFALIVGGAWGLVATVTGRWL